MKINKAGLKLIKEFEGCKLTAYKDEVGVWTIGYGITNSDYSITGKKISKGMKISQNIADTWLENALNKLYAPHVEKYNKKYNWNGNEFSALISFAYNIGSIDTLTAKGTRTKKEIAAKMLEYNKAGGRVYAGLTRRRKAERELFLTPVSVPKTGVITTKGGVLNCREKASTSSKIIKTIPNKSKVDIIDSREKWCKVKYKNVTGWCSTNYIKF